MLSLAFTWPLGGQIAISRKKGWPLIASPFYFRAGSSGYGRHVTVKLKLPKELQVHQFFTSQIPLRLFKKLLNWLHRLK
jgi:hypothetical protein